MEAYVINLDKRPDRMESLKMPFSYTRVSAVDGQTLENVPVKMRGHIGCFRSHFNLLTDLVSSEDDFTFVFEDDIEFVDNFIVELDRISKEMPEDWDILYLGGSNVGTVKPYSESLDKAERVWGTYAYVIRKKFIPILLHHLSTKEWKVDVQFSELLPYVNAFICKPTLVKHALGYSDIQYKNIEVRN